MSFEQWRSLRRLSDPVWWSSVRIQTLMLGFMPPRPWNLVIKWWCPARPYEFHFYFVLHRFFIIFLTLLESSQIAYPCFFSEISYQFLFYRQDICSKSTCFDTHIRGCWYFINAIFTLHTFSWYGWGWKWREWDKNYSRHRDFCMRFVI